jgi:hypothetical protein
MAAPAGRITRADLEGKLREIRGEVEQGAERAVVPIVAAAGVAVVGLVVFAYVLGRRKGKKNRTVIEVKRS